MEGGREGESEGSRGGKEGVRCIARAREKIKNSFRVS